MPRYKAIIEYLGSPYLGWQKQYGVKTIQEEIQNAIYKLSSQRVNVICAGRTDAGVHALGQVIHFDLQKNFKEFELLRALNFYLQESFISFLQIHIVDSSFHARFSAISRHYLYTIINRTGPLALQKDRAYFIYHPLDLECMQQAAEFFIGQHDFSSFKSSQCCAKSSIKTLYKLSIERIDEQINIYVSANAFLHHMVRNIVGTLVLVGQKKMPANKISEILQARDRSKAGPTAPAAGLYFLRAEYN